MLGDNFYGEMPEGVNSRRWIAQFEQMYPSSLFPGPAYAVLGNHDYETFRGNKVKAELAYTRQSTRWTMPRRWYSVKLPKENPLLTLICLDSNIPGSKGLDLWPWSIVLTKQQHDEQQAWFEAELAKPRTTPFSAVAAHHPLYGNGQHRDNPKLIAQWDSLLRRHNVDLYLSGHDHDLQHLEFKRSSHVLYHLRRRRGGARRLDDAAPEARAMGSSCVRIYRLADLKGGSSGQTYRQVCNRPLRVQKAGRSQPRLLIARRVNCFFATIRMDTADY